MLGIDDLNAALRLRPEVLRNVGPQHWDRLDAALLSGEYIADFDAAWANGQAFLSAGDGLRCRVPRVVEWKGPHNPPGFDFLPADLRVDHVFLVSCKYLSRILANSSPSNLFDRALADRSGGRREGDWYALTAGEAYETFYEAVRTTMRASGWRLPARPDQMSQGDREAVRGVCGRRWPDDLLEPWQAVSAAVSQASAERWLERLDTTAKREEMLWRLLRLNPAPYFILGSSPAGALRMRIGTPWDWRQLFVLRAFHVTADPLAGQPTVRWRAVVERRGDGSCTNVDGHVEVRWSHGRFSSVEAKVYLDTDHRFVPGFFDLV